MNQLCTTFDSISKYYDLLYHDKDYSGEVLYILDLLKRLSFNGKEVLEFGSGTGQHGRLLAKNGLNILGVEMSSSMLTRSCNSDGFTAVLGDARDFQSGKEFDLVLSLFHVVSYQTSDHDIESIFSNAARNLRPGGLFVFDCWFTPAVLYQHPETRIKRISDGSAEVTRIAEPEIFSAENIVKVNYTVFVRDLATDNISEFTETHNMRHFTAPELNRIAASVGFINVNTESFLDGKPPTINTWGVCFAYRKEI